MPSAGRLPLQPGEKILGYVIEEQVGFGGFGIVYRARHPAFEEISAIKEYYPQGMDSTRDGTSIHVDPNNQNVYDRFLEKFEETTVNLRKLNHPNIVKVNNFERKNGTGYMLMDFIEGKTLEQWVKSEKSISAKKFREIMKPVMHALDYLHSMNMYHRDLSPLNIMITKDFKPVIIDFGALKQAVQTGSAGGVSTTIVPANPRYAPPEQVANDPNLPVDAHTDVYSVAATMYRIVCDQYPQESETRTRSIALGGEDPQTPSVGNRKLRFTERELKAIDRAMSLKAKNRYPTIADFADALGWEIEGLQRPPNNSGVFDGTDHDGGITIPTSGAGQDDEGGETVPIQGIKGQQTSGDGNGNGASGGGENDPAPDGGKKKSRLLPQLAVAGVVLVAGIAMAMANGWIENPFADRSNETFCADLQNLNDVVEDLNPDDLESYITRCSAVEGQHVAAAKQRLKRLNKDEENWAALDKTDLNALETFIRNASPGKRLDEAKELVERINEDNNLFARVNRSGSITRLQTYLDTFPNGRHSEAVREQIAALRATEDQAFKAIQFSRRISDFDQFIREFPNGEKREQAERLRQSLVDSEREEWPGIANSTSIGVFERYLEQFPDGAHVAEAEERIAEIKADRAWVLARNTGTEEALRAFLREHRNSRHVPEARKMLQELEGASRVIDEWARVRNSRDIEALKDFRRKYPNSQFDNSARTLISQLEQEEADRRQQEQLAEAERLRQERLENEEKRRKEQDRANWIIARDTDKIESYTVYLNNSNNKDYRTQANRRRNELQEERSLALRASNAQDIELAREYLRRYPNGYYRREMIAIVNSANCSSSGASDNVLADQVREVLLEYHAALNRADQRAALRHFPSMGDTTYQRIANFESAQITSGISVQIRGGFPRTADTRFNNRTKGVGERAGKYAMRVHLSCSGSRWVIENQNGSRSIR